MKYYKKFKDYYVVHAHGIIVSLSLISIQTELDDSFERPFCTELVPPKSATNSLIIIPPEVTTDAQLELIPWSLLRGPFPVMFHDEQQDWPLPVNAKLSCN